MGKRNETFLIQGMNCISCRDKIEKALKKANGIESVSVSYEKGNANVRFDDEKITMKEIEKIVTHAGYEIAAGTIPETKLSRTVSLLALIAALFLLLQRSGILNMLAPSQLADNGMSYGMLFLIGLLTSVHCIAMCGGINLSQCIGKEASLHHAFLYNIGRVLSYTGIGFALGLIGSLAGGGTAAGIPIILQGILKLLAGALMVLMGMNMLNLFPCIRRFMPHIPGKLAVWTQNKKAGSGAFVVGLLNGFMPCGPLQSMQIVALASANPVSGAASMFAFSLGTVPLMLGLGSIVTMLGKNFSQKVMNVGAVLVVVLGLAMISQGSSLSGFLHRTEQEDSAAEHVAANQANQETVQEIHSTLTGGRYPHITVTEGVPVKWIIDVPTNALNGCNYKMILGAYGIEHTFTEGENIIEFTPTKAGDVPYTCWMGMMRGIITVTAAM